jgi:hypothetical protein
MQSGTTQGRNDTDTLPEARLAIDSTVAELAEEAGLDHRELGEALLEARDTLLVTGRVPDWFGNVDTERYAKMVRD